MIEIGELTESIIVQVISYNVPKGQNDMLLVFFSFPPISCIIFRHDRNGIIYDALNFEI